MTNEFELGLDEPTEFDPLPPDRDTREPLDSGLMQRQLLAEEQAQVDMFTSPHLPEDYELEIRQANESMMVSTSMEHARNVPGVEYPDLDAYLAASERIYNIMKTGYPSVDTE